MMQYLRNWTALVMAAILLCSAEAVPVAFAEDDSEESVITQLGVIVLDDDMPGSLLDDYLTYLFYGGEQVAIYGVGGWQYLDASTRCLYDALKQEIEKVANGERASTSLQVTSSQFEAGGIDTRLVGDNRQLAFENFLAQFDLSNLLTALLRDCPYSLYWFDKTIGVSIGGNLIYSGDLAEVSSITFHFAVVEDLQGEEYEFPANPVADVTMAIRASQAAANAKQIVSDCDGLSDYERLIAYRDQICGMVKYDYTAAAYGQFSEDADPWQLISVFDNDAATNVVCEGYSKAFQYLCDLTEFSGDTSCWTVTGTIQTDTEPETHMWNIVSLEGNHYLADVTNSDEHSFGADGSLFLAGTSGSVLEGYSFNGRVYRYDDSSLSLWNSSGDTILRLCETSYVPGDIPSEPQEPVEENPPIDSDPAEPESVETVPMYRLYNSNSGEHFYTGSTEERDMLVLAGWNYEGVSWNAPKKTGSPVYRTYNPNASDHHYTMSWEEVENLEKAGWNYEGVAWNSASADNIPLYRLFNPNAEAGTHHYTGSIEEKDNLVSLGWILEGIGWFGMLQ